MCTNGFSHVQLFVTLWTVALQAPLSMGFSRQGYWSGLSFPPPGDLPDPGIEPMSLMSPALAGGFFTTSTMPCLGSPDQARPERMGIWSSCKCSDRRSALPAIQRCPAPSHGCLQLQELPVPGRSAPGEVHPHLVLGNLLGPGLTRCGCFRVCVTELNHRGRRTVPIVGGNQQPPMPGPVDPAATSHCRLWKNTVQAMENENRKRQFWGSRISKCWSHRVEKWAQVILGRWFSHSPRSVCAVVLATPKVSSGAGGGKVEDFSGL